MKTSIGKLIVKILGWARDWLVFIKTSADYCIGILLFGFVGATNIGCVQSIFKSKRVIVLGTGPSLDCITRDLLEAYDVVVFLNASIRIAGQIDLAGLNLIWLNGDFYRFLELKREIQGFKYPILSLFVPIHLHLFHRHFCYLGRKNSFLINPALRLGKPSEKHATRSIVTYKFASRSEILEGRISPALPILPHTIALTAFMVIISSGCLALHHIGCDFGAGRARLVAQDPANFKRKNILLWYNLLEKLADSRRISFSPALSVNR